eukprot:TRINITY_DN11235_c0_g1_i14.p1 TRINITY_DN11235_c0_g1~~TRINITY_DN11235_c0_g1_i14.p1  ORF type:complete len:153 (+),score=22.12 TRINITY_DN11235_c0_g1_i14:179-637(+)
MNRISNDEPVDQFENKNTSTRPQRITRARKQVQYYEGKIVKRKPKKSLNAASNRVMTSSVPDINPDLDDSQRDQMELIVKKERRLKNKEAVRKYRKEKEKKECKFKVENTRLKKQLKKLEKELKKAKINRLLKRPRPENYICLLYTSDAADE